MAIKAPSLVHMALGRDDDDVAVVPEPGMKDRLHLRTGSAMRKFPASMNFGAYLLDVCRDLAWMSSNLIPVNQASNMLYL